MFAMYFNSLMSSMGTKPTHSNEWMQKSENEMVGWFCAALAKLQNVFIIFYVKLAELWGRKKKYYSLFATEIRTNFVRDFFDIHLLKKCVTLKHHRLLQLENRNSHLTFHLQYHEMTCLPLWANSQHCGHCESQISKIPTAQCHDAHCSTCFCL